MSLKKVKQVRSDRGFKIWDLAVYAALAVLIVTLFIAFVFTRDDSPVGSVTVSYGYGDGQRAVCSYDFSSDRLTFVDSSCVRVDSEGKDGVQVTFFNGEEYNIIYFDRANSSVRVTEANCPSLDCVHSSPITSNSSLPIVCAAHRLIISADAVSGSVIQ